MVWIGLAVVLLILLLVALRLKKYTASESLAYPYQKNTVLFTPAEGSFLGVLDQLLGDDYRIMGKVRMADVVGVPPLKDRKAWRAAFNCISTRHFDFILCDRDNLSPIAAIELDDKSHGTAKRRQEDEFVDGLCHAAGLPLFRMPARRAYTRSDVERLIVSRLTPPAEDHSATDLPASQVAPAVNTVSNAAPERPRCPKCDSSMVLRRIKRGTRAGQRLWGCTRFPDCRGARPVKPAAPAQEVPRQKAATPG